MARSLISSSRGIFSPEGILREIQINLLECKVCFEKFSTEQREHRPQNLSCGHVLCLGCIAALSHPVQRKLECPFCRQLCSIDNTSKCQVLADLQELLLFWSSTASVPHHGAKEGTHLAAGLTSTVLHLSAAFGGWGTLTNPTGIAVMSSSRRIVVVHDGAMCVVVFNRQGKKLHMFGRRGKGSGEICYPMDVAVTPCGGYVVVTDAGNKAVKGYTSKGNHMFTVEDSFQMPWSVDTDSCGHILVSDVQAGTLSRIKVKYANCLVLDHQTVVSDLQHPKAVACCHVTGNVAVMEHLTCDTFPPERHHNTRLRVFRKDFQLLYQTDGFSLTLQSLVRLSMSGVAFDRDGNVMVIDSNQGMIWSLENLQNDLTLSPLVGDHLTRPAGLVSLNDALVVLDSGDHTVKIYSIESDAGSI